MRGQVRLIREHRETPRSAGGTVSYLAYLDRRWVGWVFDSREWRGHRFGSRRWHAAWREMEDSAARANTFDLPAMRTRTEAAAWLEQTIKESQA